MTPRRFPPPWTIEEHNDACFIVSDKNGQALAYFYFEDEAGRHSAANLLTRDEALGDGVKASWTTSAEKRSGEAGSPRSRPMA
jgi:phage portal protein BeeE